jgi:hypothetical protein
MDERAVMVSCWSCGAPFGRLGEPGQADLIKGLKKERPIAYAFEDDDA